MIPSLIPPHWRIKLEPSLSVLRWVSSPLTLCGCVCSELCPTPSDPLAYSPPGSPVHGVFQASTLEWLAMSSSRGSCRPGIKPECPILQVDCLLLSLELHSQWSIVQTLWGCLSRFCLLSLIFLEGLQECQMFIFQRWLSPPSLNCPKAFREKLSGKG